MTRDWPECDRMTTRTLAPESQIHLYREMVRIRAFEEMAMEYYQRGHMAGWLFLQRGQESIPVALRFLMGPHDHSICGHRGMGYAIAAGLSMRSGMAELFGKATGCSKGKSGALGFHDPEHNHWGSHGFVATQTALASGLAFALKHKGETGAVFCVLGDGAVNQGTFHEALNLTALFHLPVIFVIENNGYAMGTTPRRASAMKDSLARRAEGYGIEWDMINADDLHQMLAKIQPAIERAHHDRRPTVLEIATYRFEGFSIADANKLKYRSREEVTERQLHHDPLALWRELLLRDGIADEDHLALIRSEAFSEASDAAVFAKDSPFPVAKSITEDVYWEIDHAKAEPPAGRHFFGS